MGKSSVLALLILTFGTISANLLGILPLPTLIPPTTQPLPPAACSASATAPKPSCSAAVDQLGYGNLVPGPSNRSDELLPSWLNIPLAIQGQEIVNQHLFSVGLGNAYGIVASLTEQSLADVLLFTGGNTEGVPQKRYAATFAQIILWSRDVFNNEQSFQNIRTSIRNVRSLHSAAGAAGRKKLAQNNGSLGNDAKYANVSLHDALWDALRLDLGVGLAPEYMAFPPSYTSTIANTVPMNQFQFSLVQWSTLGLIMLNPEPLLVYDLTDEKLYAMCHLWAALGYALGIDDQYNLCLEPTIAAQKQYFRDYFNLYITPAIYSPTRSSKVLIEVVATAVVAGDIPFFANQTVEFALAFMFRRMAKDFWNLSSTTNLDNASPPAAMAASLFYENVFAPTSRLLNFQGAETAVWNALIFTVGQRYFPGNYTTDENIAKTVFHPAPNSTYTFE